MYLASAPKKKKKKSWKSPEKVFFLQIKKKIQKRFFVEKIFYPWKSIFVAY